MRALGLALQAMGRRYVRSYNDRHAERGALFDGRYRAAILEPDSAFLGALQFVETQPVRAGLVAAAEDYRWSSFRHHAGFASDPTLKDHSLYWALGNTPFERQVAYRAAVHAGLASADVARFDKALAGGWVVGSDAFVRAIAPLCSRRPMPVRAGRPRLNPPPDAELSEHTLTVNFVARKGCTGGPVWLRRGVPDRRQLLRPILLKIQDHGTGCHAARRSFVAIVGRRHVGSRPRA